jgi:hypothetical protein
MSPAGSPLLARRVAAIPGVERVQPVTGPYDLIVEVTSDGDGLVSRITALDGVLHALEAPVIAPADAA